MSWQPIPPEALAELAGFPAALLPDLPIPVVLGIGETRLVSHQALARAGVIAPEAWLPVLSSAGVPGASVGHLCWLYGGRIDGAWWLIKGQAITARRAAA